MNQNENEIFLQKYIEALKTKTSTLIFEIVKLETQLAISNDKVNGLAQELGQVKDELTKLKKK